MTVSWKQRTASDLTRSARSTGILPAAKPDFVLSFSSSLIFLSYFPMFFQEIYIISVLSAR